MNLEVEKTYTFSLEDSKDIIKTLTLLDCSVENVHLKKSKVTNALHIIISDERKNYKNRIKILLSDNPNNPVEIIYSPKVRISNIEEVLQTYLEENVLINETNNHFFFPLNIHVKAIYFKKKLKLIYNINKSKIIVAVDQISAINPLNIKQKTDSYYNMEIEGKDSIEIDNVLNILLPTHRDHIRIIGVNESKEVIASLYCPTDTILQFLSIDSLISYARDVKDICIAHFDDIYSISISENYRS